MTTHRGSSSAPCTRCAMHAEAVFRVEGMDCHEEVVILERRLKPLAGLESLSADVVGQRLHVSYDAARLTTAAMVDAVGETGMRIWLEHDAPREGASDAGSRFWLMAASAAAMVAGVVAGRWGSASVSVTAYITAAVVGGVFPARRAYVALRARTVDINVLMVIAVCGALILRDWFEAAAVILLFAVAQWLEVRTLARARNAIRALLDLSPPSATVRRAGREVTVRVEELVPGDEVLVRPGEKVPVDGVLLAGRGEVNEAPLTGESLPVDKAPGDEVYAGTINGRGALDVRVSRIGRDTRVARIIHLVEVAQGQRAPVQAFVDRFARIYTPIVIALAIVVALVPPLAAGASMATWSYRALVLLVIACPCALVISTPVSIVAALSAAARNGVLIKGGAHLERLATVKAIAFDKTGTLTRGLLEVGAVAPADGVDVWTLVALAGAVESRSEHPIGRAIAAYARQHAPALSPVEGFVALPGHGARAAVDGRLVHVGNERLLQTLGVADAIVAPLTERLGTGTRSVVFIVADGRVLGAIALADQARGTAREALDLLRAQGVERIVMLTGDRRETAQAVAGSLALDAYHAALLPEQKHGLIGDLRASVRGPVMMVGDGVNDAPALAAADVGVAMGAAGSDVAIETADVALMSDELLKLPYAVRLAQATLRNVRTNVAVSLVLKSLFLLLAIAGSATLWMAVLADTGASVIVVGNALRLLRTR